MKRIRRTFIVLGVLLLIGGLLSYHRHYQTLDPRGSDDTFAFIAADQWFTVQVSACTRRSRPYSERFFDFGVLSLGILTMKDGGWCASLQGRWFVWAVIVGVPSLACELIAHRRKRRAAGFPIEPTPIVAQRGE
jgi:hypothetical protein